MGAATGLELDESAWELSMAQLRASVSANGGVRYWTMAGTGTGDATLRTGSLALGLLLSGREPARQEKLQKSQIWHAPQNTKIDIMAGKKRLRQ